MYVKLCLKVRYRGDRVEGADVLTNRGHLIDRVCRDDDSARPYYLESDEERRFEEFDHAYDRIAAEFFSAAFGAHRMDNRGREITVRGRPVPRRWDGSIDADALRELLGLDRADL